MKPLNGNAFSLETSRLTVIPLLPLDFALLLEGVPKLEQAKGWRASGESWDDHTREAMRGLYAMQQEAMRQESETLANLPQENLPQEVTTERSSKEFSFASTFVSSAFVWAWYTNWRILWKSENVCVGSACFMGQPDARGVVEIGYGTHTAYRNRGFMTEAVGAMLRWALDQPRVSQVIAESERENVASHRVLEKNGMRLIRQTETSLFYATVPDDAH